MRKKMKKHRKIEFQTIANSRWWLVAAVLCIVLAALTSHEPQSAPRPDPAFERRLTRDAFYRSRPRDTLERVSYYLYGKRSWWEKLRAQNPELNSFEPHDRLPSGTLIHYRAPEVGESYVVQPGDWLIRIVEWKYGDREKWEQVFQLNSRHLENPNLIHPGDTIDLTEDGRVTHRGTGVVLMNAEKQLKRTSSWFGAGMVLGFLFLAGLGFALRFYGSADTPKSRKKIGGVFDGSNASEEPEEEIVPQKSRAPEDYPYGFKRRPVELFRPGFKPTVDQDGEVETRNGYQRISKRRMTSKSRKTKRAS